MPDSESSKPVERLRADPLKVAASADPVVARRLDEERRAVAGTEPETEVVDASVQRDETQAVDEERAEAERQERERQDAAQAQAEQVEASRIEAERVAAAHIVLGTQTASSIPMTQPAPLVDGFVEARPADDEPPQPDKAPEVSTQPEAVIDEPGALTTPKTKSVATKVSVKTAGELAAEADRREVERDKADEAQVAASNESSHNLYAMAESTPVRPEKAPKASRPTKTPKPPRERSANRDRNWRVAAGIVGTVGLVCSVILAAGALLFALGADQGSGFVGSIADLCNFLVGPLSDLFNFSGRNAETKQALVTWGLGSMIYLLASRLVQSLLMRRVQGR